MNLHTGPQIESDSQRAAWEQRYQERGRQWGNAPGEFTQTPERGVILELGAGDGKNLRTRRMLEGILIGLDFSISALQLCREDPVLKDVTLVLGDARYLPFSNASVHQVFAHHILGHLQKNNQTVLMKEILRVLMPGGILALTVFGSGDMRKGKGREIEPSTYLRGDGIITRYYDREDIEAISQGFIITGITCNHWPFRVKEKEYQRSLLTATLQKPQR